MHYGGNMDRHIDYEYTISNVYDHLYANSNIRTPSGIAKELSKILKTKIFLKSSRKLTNSFENLDFIDEKNLSKEFGTQFRLMNKKWKAFDENEELELDPKSILYVLTSLSDLDFQTNDKDLLGDTIEAIRSNWAKRSGGQFFTDQKVTQLAVKLLQFNPSKGEDFIDISCGTGGFLLAATEYINDLGLNIKKDKIASLLKGQEVDKEVAQIANASLKARMPGLSDNLVNIGNSLEPGIFNLANGRIKENSHYCAATNPPFGIKISVKDAAILRQFELSIGGTGSLAVSRPLDLLLLEQNIRLLKKGIGRLAIVLPYQILSGPQMHFVRKWLLQNVEVLAVVDLPVDTFQPHTGTKTSLLIAKRRKKPIKIEDINRDQDIFFACPEQIGHDRRGNPVFVDNNKANEILTDIPQVGLAFEGYLAGKNPSSIFDFSYKMKIGKVIDDSTNRINAKYYYEIKIRASKTSKKKKTVRLGDVVESVFFPGRFKRNYVSKGPNSVPFLGGTNILQFKIITDKFLSVKDRKYKELKVEHGWILVTRSGSTGLVSRVPKAWDGYAVSEHIIRIIPDDSKLSGHYLYGFLQTDSAKSYLKQGIFGSVIDEITSKHLLDMEIPLPTSKNELDSIVAELKLSEDKRAKAIEGLNKGIKSFEMLFS